VVLALSAAVVAQPAAEVQVDEGKGGLNPVVPITEKEVAFDLGGGVAMKLRLIPAGKFTIGTPPDQVTSRERRNERYQKEITLFRSFYMGVTEVTQTQWKAVMGTEPWAGMRHAGLGAECAANYISWAEATAFCEKLSGKTKIANWG
jgi:formylglycine-generating enzyme required for sulfatase activity